MKEAGKDFGEGVVELHAAQVSELASIPGVGTAAAQALKAFLSDEA